MIQRHFGYFDPLNNAFVVENALHVAVLPDGRSDDDQRLDDAENIELVVCGKQSCLEISNEMKRKSINGLSISTEQKKKPE